MPEQNLHDQGFAVYEGRVISSVAPAVNDEDLRAIRARCRGPIPEPLIELWSLTFGGQLDYELSADFGRGTQHALSCTELFGGTARLGQRTVQEWIEVELQAAAEEAQRQGEPAPDVLNFVPFAGFGEYERFFVRVDEGPDHGSIWVWSHALSPAVTGSTEPSGVARIADDLSALFASFHLSARLDESSEKRPIGRTLRRSLDDLAEIGVAEQALADQLWALHQSAALDWRGELEAGRFPEDSRLLPPAVIGTARTDDDRALRQLLDIGVDPSAPLVRNGNLLDHAAAHGASRCVRQLLALGVTAERSVAWGAAALESSLLMKCVEAGAFLSPVAVMSAIRNPDPQALVVLAHRLVEQSAAERDGLVDALRVRAEDDGSFADELDAGTAVSPRGDAASFRATAVRLQALADQLEAGA